MMKLISPKGEIVSPKHHRIALKARRDGSSTSRHGFALHFGFSHLFLQFLLLLLEVPINSLALQFQVCPSSTSTSTSDCSIETLDTPIWKFGYVPPEPLLAPLWVSPNFNLDSDSYIDPCFQPFPDEVEGTVVMLRWRNKYCSYDTLINQCHDAGCVGLLVWSNGEQVTGKSSLRSAGYSAGEIMRV